MYTNQKDKQQPKCVLCYKVLFNESTKPSKLHRHLDDKHKEHATNRTDFFFFKSKEQEVWKNKTMVKKEEEEEDAAGCNNENTARKFLNR